MSNFNTFTYGDKCSDEFNIICDVETLSMLPNQRVYQMDIPGYDGSTDFGVGGYDKRNLQLKLYYMGDYKDLRANREKIMAWLSSHKGQYKKLYLGTDTKYYKAKVISQFDFQITSNKEIGCVTFECNPPWQFEGEVLQTPEEILWTNQDRVEGNQWLKKFTKSDNFRITNNGSPIKPLIKLYGNIHKDLKLSLGTDIVQFKDDLGSTAIYIDCENETVLSGTENVYDKLSSCDYFTLPKDKVEITVEDSLLGDFPESLSMIIEFDRKVGVE